MTDELGTKKDVVNWTDGEFTDEPLVAQRGGGRKRQLAGREKMCSGSVERLRGVLRAPLLIELSVPVDGSDSARRLRRASPCVRRPLPSPNPARSGVPVRGAAAPPAILDFPGQILLFFAFIFCLFIAVGFHACLALRCVSRNTKGRNGRGVSL